MASELYTATEISRMTNDALDELLSYYQDKGNGLGAEMVQDEITTRYDDDMDDSMEAMHEAEQERKQQLHDEMVNDMLIEDGRFG
jgi:hypothetical protein